jgi:hypothetical protein
MPPEYYLLMIWHDVEPELLGPWPTHEERDSRAKMLKELHGDEHGLFPMMLDENGLIVGCYSGADFDEIDVIPNGIKVCKPRSPTRMDGGSIAKSTLCEESREGLPGTRD